MLLLKNKCILVESYAYLIPISAVGDLSVVTSVADPVFLGCPDPDPYSIKRPPGTLLYVVL